MISCYASPAVVMKQYIFLMACLAAVATLGIGGMGGCMVDPATLNGDHVNPMFILAGQIAEGSGGTPAGADAPSPGPGRSATRPAAAEVAPAAQPVEAPP